MSNHDLDAAGHAERLGDDAEGRQTSEGYYREAQRLLLPVGVVWTCREEYDRRMEAFERIQRKIYGLEQRESFVRTPAAPPVPAPAAERVAPAAPVRELSVAAFSPGLVVKVCRTFVDYDGQEIREGEILHFLDLSYFPYDGGYTLRFAEKTIRLADIADPNVPVIENAGNAWFLPIGLDRTEPPD